MDTVRGKPSSVDERTDTERWYDAQDRAAFFERKAQRQAARTGRFKAERDRERAEVERLWGMMQEIRKEADDESEPVEERLAMVKAIVRDALKDS